MKPAQSKRTSTESPKVRTPVRTYDVKNTTEKPIQLATTPIAEYELMNMSGRNS